MKKFICIFTLIFSVFLSFAKEKILSENEYPDFIKEFIDGKPYIVYGRNNTWKGIYNVDYGFTIDDDCFDVELKVAKDGKNYIIYLYYKYKGYYDVIHNWKRFYKFENNKLIELNENDEYIVNDDTCVDNINYKFIDNKLLNINVKYYTNNKIETCYDIKLEYTNNEIIMNFNNTNNICSVNIDNNFYDFDYNYERDYKKAYRMNGICKVYYDKDFNFKKAEDDAKVIELKDGYLIKTHKDKSSYYHTFYYDLDFNMIKRIGKNHLESRTYQNGKCICIESEDNGKKTIEYLDYNEKGLVVSEKRLNYDGEWLIDEYKYDDKNRIIYCITKHVDENEKLISQLEEWSTYDENNFVILCKWKTDDNSSWSSFINGYKIENIKGTIEYRFEKINDTKMKVIPQDKHWFIVEKE